MRGRLLLRATVGFALMGLALAGPAAAKRTHLELPSAKTCKQRSHFMLRLKDPHGVRIRRATVYVNGRRVARLRGRRLHRRFRVRHIPRGRRFTLKVVAVTSHGRKLKRRRRYRPCGHAAPPGGPIPGCGDPRHPGGEWRSYGHDLANSRNQDEEHSIGVAQAPSLGPVWTFSTTAAGGRGDFTGTPAVADGCVFVGSTGGWVFAINADTGRVVWRAHAPEAVWNSVAVWNGLVIAGVTNTTQDPCGGPQCDGPYVVALDERTGRQVWRTNGPIDTQAGSDLYGSPVVYDPTPRRPRNRDAVVIQGVSGWSAEGQNSLADEGTRDAFEGSIVLLDPLDGKLLKKVWTIHPPASRCPASTCPQGTNDQNAGATVWTTAAVDPQAGVAYMGTGNPFNPNVEDPHANAVLKLGVNRRDPGSFGRVLASGKGTVDTYAAADGVPCVNPPTDLDACGDQDLDFGASPNLFTDDHGRRIVGAGQKSGVYHAFDTATMRHVWQTTLGPPSLVGGIVGSSGIDGGSIVGPTSIGGTLWSVDRSSGALEWTTPIGDLVHYGNPVALANGVAYTTTAAGYLDGYDAATGAQLLHHSLSQSTQTGSDSVMAFSGTSVARNTVYAAVGMEGNPNGFIIAFRPGGRGSPPPDRLPPPEGGGNDGDASSAQPVIAPPGAQSTGFLTRIVITRQGSPLAFQNLDVAVHDVTARKLGPAGQPLFQSQRTGTGQGTIISGADKLPPGTYGFYCSIHPSMTGQIEVQPK